MDPFDPKRLALQIIQKAAPTKAQPFHPKQGGTFLKGLIPLAWLGKAGGLPGKALHVTNALWFLGGIKKNRTVTLTKKTLPRFGVERNAGYRGLAALEEAGLLKVIRRLWR